MNTNELRAKFLEFFRSKGHTVVPSASLVPGNDPTLLFTNAGMVQFKDVFTGQDKRPYVRAASLAEVRARRRQAQRSRERRLHRTPPHVLRDAWQLQLRRLLQAGRDPFRLGVHHLKAVAGHRQVTPAGHGVRVPTTRLTTSGTRRSVLPADRIVRIGDNKGAKYASDNFWAMGDTGPCGPCTEIFYDHGPKIAGRPAGQQGRGRRSLDRDLEPGVHAVRARRRRHARASCRPPASTPAWAWSASAR